MIKKHWSAKKVLKKIRATDFCNLKTDQIIEFTSYISKMDKEVAVKCIEQFVNFKEQSIEIVKQLYALYDKAIELNKNNSDKSIDAYQAVLDNLSKQLECDNISEEFKTKIIDTMVDVANKINDTVKENRWFLAQIIGINGILAALVFVISFGMLGGSAKIKQRK